MQNASYVNSSNGQIEITIIILILQVKTKA